ncbi:MAG: 4-hydroxybutyryl-CoA dehydratase [Clostridiales Family XIII bacterium]|jgi:4-hydroxybutyryl-CoA dehydratase/vinylacetyl-CoA-Delta-isomerase|nr:4-hydroxybutyryl-CoA dehydratase [Clostridiales Family XIII bacterium]
MGLMNGSEYIGSLHELHPQVFMFGMKVDNWWEHPILRPSINNTALTYNLAFTPEMQDSMTAISTGTGNRIHRFNQLYMSQENLMVKSKLLRLLGCRTAASSSRSSGMDALNAVFSSTYACDKANGGNYYANFLKYLTYVQERDLAVCGASEDPAGLYTTSGIETGSLGERLRVVETRPDGIVVQGVKLCPNGALGSHEYLVLPAVRSSSDVTEAVCFSCPSDVPGLILVYGRRPNDTRNLEQNADVDLGNRAFGEQQAMLIFDRVFIPFERIFLNGETGFANEYARRYAEYRAHSYALEKAGIGDALIGAVSIAAEYSGESNSPSFQNGLAKMIEKNETLYNMGLACISSAEADLCGNPRIQPTQAALCNAYALRIPHKLAHLALSFFGKSLLYIPSKTDVLSETKVPTPSEKTLHEWMETLVPSTGSPAQNRIRILRFIENICLGSVSVGFLTDSAQEGDSLRTIYEKLHQEVNQTIVKTLAGVE